MLYKDVYHELLKYEIYVWVNCTFFETFLICLWVCILLECEGLIVSFQLFMFEYFFIGSMYADFRTQFLHGCSSPVVFFPSTNSPSFHEQE